ncbi:MAG: hypothetical protein ABSC64_04910 [Candidatus Korobacteraceae bacterium]|jgi:hypothetical protein
MKITKCSYKEEYNQFLDEQRILEFQTRPSVEKQKKLEKLGMAKLKKLTGEERAAVKLYFEVDRDEGLRRVAGLLGPRKLKAIAAGQTGEQTGPIHQGRKTGKRKL